MLALLLPGLMLSSLAARAAELPVQKPGLWETTIHQGSADSAHGHPTGGTLTHCLDAKAIAQQSKQAAKDDAAKNCSKNETRFDGGAWVTDMVCKQDAKTTMKVHLVTKVTGDYLFHTEATTTFDPPEEGESQHTTIIDNKWIGACKGK